MLLRSCGALHIYSEYSKRDIVENYPGAFPLQGTLFGSFGHRVPIMRTKVFCGTYQARRGYLFFVQNGNFSPQCGLRFVRLEFGRIMSAPSSRVVTC